MSYEGLWVRYFALTVAIELIVALPLLRGAGSLPRRVGAVVVGNLATHPIVWFVLARVLAPRWVMVCTAESWAIACEAVVYALVFPAMPRTRALGVSGVANAVSFLVGLVLTRL
ncbi:MAG TPA: hypothetical protein VGL81_10640 [Polyangiaceae bacterium]|jgi:hypothetical protein